MIESYTKFDFFDKDIVYTNEEAQELYVEIIEKGKQFFLETEHSNVYQDTISELFEKIREFHKSETIGYSIFSRIDVKTVFFELMIDYKVAKYINLSVSRQNEYKKYLLDALKLMHTIAMYKRTRLKDVFKNIRPKYHFLAFTHSLFLQEIYEGLVNEVDYCIGKLSELGLLVNIDFENGFISTNGLKYSFLKGNEVSVEFQYKNPYPRIFKNKSCFNLFEWLQENLVVDKYADYSFIYYKMVETGLIYKISHKEYIDFLNDNLSIDLNYEKLKPSASNVSSKKKILANGIDLIKPLSTVF